MRAVDIANSYRRRKRKRTISKIENNDRVVNDDNVNKLSMSTNSIQKKQLKEPTRCPFQRIVIEGDVISQLESRNKNTNIDDQLVVEGRTNVTDGNRTSPICHAFQFSNEQLDYAEYYKWSDEPSDCIDLITESHIASPSDVLRFRVPIHGKMVLRTYSFVNFQKWIASIRTSKDQFELDPIIVQELTTQQQIPEEFVTSIEYSSVAQQQQLFVTIEKEYAQSNFEWIMTNIFDKIDAHHLSFTPSFWIQLWNLPNCKVDIDNIGNSSISGTIISMMEHSLRIRHRAWSKLSSEIQQAIFDSLLIDDPRRKLEPFLGPQCEVDFHDDALYALRFSMTDEDLFTLAMYIVVQWITDYHNETHTKFSRFLNLLKIILKCPASLITEVATLTLAQVQVLYSTLIQHIPNLLRCHQLPVPITTSSLSSLSSCSSSSSSGLSSSSKKITLPDTNINNSIQEKLSKIQQSLLKHSEKKISCRCKCTRLNDVWQLRYSHSMTVFTLESTCAFDENATIDDAKSANSTTAGSRNNNIDCSPTRDSWLQWYGESLFQLFNSTLHNMSLKRAKLLATLSDQLTLFFKSAPLTRSETERQMDNIYATIVSLQAIGMTYFQIVNSGTLEHDETLVLQLELILSSFLQLLKRPSQKQVYQFFGSTMIGTNPISATTDTKVADVKLLNSTFHNRVIVLSGANIQSINRTFHNYRIEFIRWIRKLFQGTILYGLRLAIGQYLKLVLVTQNENTVPAPPTSTTVSSKKQSKNESKIQSTRQMSMISREFLKALKCAYYLFLNVSPDSNSKINLDPKTLKNFNRFNELKIGPFKLMHVLPHLLISTAKNSTVNYITKFCTSSSMESAIIPSSILASGPTKLTSKLPKLGTVTEILLHAVVKTRIEFERLTIMFYKLSTIHDAIYYTTNLEQFNTINSQVLETKTEQHYDHVNQSLPLEPFVECSYDQVIFKTPFSATMASDESATLMLPNTNNNVYCDLFCNIRSASVSVEPIVLEICLFDPKVKSADLKKLLSRSPNNDVQQLIQKVQAVKEVSSKRKQDFIEQLQMLAPSSNNDD